MDEKIIKETINVHKAIAKAVIDDSELRTLNAKAAKLAHEAYVKEGFNPQEAIQLVCAILNSASK